MEPFLDAFFAVDVDHSDVITTEDLRTYVERHNLDEKMVRSWKRLFDPENTGYITLEKFCEVFGIKKEEAHKIRIERMKVPVEKLGSDVYRSSSTLLYPPGELGNREIAQNLKLWLQKVYGPTWHVVVLRGAYGLSYTHLENRSFQFQLQDRCFLIWGTPSEYQLV
ncbi:unnamed protein product [Heterobilharzia americana]|nr:unnamed protein product [Heterobilharzia americana]